jgi:glutamyl-tRNA synthetase
MQIPSPVTRFAPSPTGSLHLGNARTALFNSLAARSRGGRLILRIEDTDAERNDPGALTALLEDLGWLGLRWDEGPDRDGPNGPYLQSERRANHARAVAGLERLGLVYPCFCTPGELGLERRTQLAARRPPRYSGKCARLPPDEVARRLAAGQLPALRFRVEPGASVEFDDAIHGVQRYATDDIGDFVIRRADGSVAFLLGNAVDDAEMGITLVLRGEDHLANTPRQLLLLRALRLAEPAYGHLPLVLAPAGRPLSKREGAASLRDLRAAGYFPAAVRNYLVRLGHAPADEGWLDDAALTAAFDLSRVSRAAPHFDEVQLRHWQRQAVERATAAELETWLGERLGRVPGARRAAFVGAVRGNLTFPADVEPLVTMIAGAALSPEPDAVVAIRTAGREFFAAAIEAWVTAGPDFGSWLEAVRTATRTSGAPLFKPLRAALTGATHGPELAPLVGLMDPELVTQRLRAAARA